MKCRRLVSRSFGGGGTNRWATAALAVVLAIGVAAAAQAPAGAQGRSGAGPGGGQGPAGAQGGGRGRGGGPNAGAPYTPAAGAKDLRSVLFNWMWHQGMLKGTDERMVATLEYQAKDGTIQVDGQPCTLSRYRASTNYQTFSQRIQYTCTRPNKQTVSNIEVPILGRERCPVANRAAASPHFALDVLRPTGRPTDGVAPWPGAAAARDA